MSRDQIKPAKLADTIADHLETLILEGALRPGEKLLPERELADKLEVSRPSLREALQKLEQRGLLESERGGTFVADLVAPAFTNALAGLLQNHPETTFDYLEFRCTVEGSAAYFAAQRATDVDRLVIRQRFEQMEAAHGKEDPTEEADADADFHLAIYEATHNVVMLHLMRGFSSMLRNDVFYNRGKLYSRRGIRNLLLEQHRSVYETIIAGDAEAARSAAEHHINFTRDALLEITRADARLEASLRRIGRAGYADLAERSRKRP